MQVFFSARQSHGTGLLTRVIRRFPTDERRHEVAADPWGNDFFNGKAGFLRFDKIWTALLINDGKTLPLYKGNYTL